jgi:3'-5' exonuclease
MWKRLHEKGLLASREVTRGRNTTRATIDGNRKTVIHLIPEALLPEDDPNGPNDPPPDKRGISGPKMRAVLPAPLSETAPNNGPEPTENGHKGTKGTIGPLSGEVSHDGVQQGASPGAAHPHLDGDAQLVRTEADLQTLAEELQNAERVGLDLETTGLDPREDRVRIISLTTAQGTWLIDCFQIDPHPLFPILANKELIAHNTVFELTFLSEMGFEQGEGSRVGDTMLMSQLLRGLRPGKEGK